MSVLAWIIAGIITGWVTGRIMGGASGLRLGLSLATGVIGGLLGGWIMHTFGVAAGSGATFALLVAILGAAVLTILIQALASRPPLVAQKPATPPGRH